MESENHPTKGSLNGTLSFLLYYDLLLRTLELYRDDYGTLYRCSLVNREFNRAASSLLYSRVVLSPPASRLYQLSLRDTGVITSPSNLPSATSPKYANLVIELEISGYLSPRAPPKNTLHSILADAIANFANLSSIKLIPSTYHADVFVDSLRLLPGLVSLQELALNPSCTDEEKKVRVLTELHGLKKLTLHSPGRAVLQILPEWLETMRDSLTELHLLDNCGSVTPGVLKAFASQIKERVKAFSLGLSYSLTDSDIFAFIDQLDSLERLKLRYYYQIKVPSYKPRLGKLKEFTAIQTPVNTIKEARNLCSWIRRIIFLSPIETLRIATEGNDEDEQEGRLASSRPAYDNLIEHLWRKHPFFLRHLDMKDCLITLNALSRLYKNCTSLESLRLSVDKRALTLFADMLPTSLNLRSASFDIHNVKRGAWKYSLNEAVQMLEKATQLTRLSVNGVAWESSWEMHESSGNQELTKSNWTPTLVVNQVQRVLPPWRRQL